MARTINEIYQEILEEKVKYASLNGLTNTSNTAIWRSVYYVTAVAIASAEQLRDVFQQDLLDIAETLPTGTPRWYADRLLEYQEGYNLSYNRVTGAVEYDVVDEDAQIIKVATTQSEGDTIVLKCATVDDDDNLINITGTTYSSVLSYINQYKFAGTIISLLSLPSDKLKLTINIRIDATKIKSNGESVSLAGQYPVEDAINNYIRNFSLVDFDARFKLINLTDAIQNVNGVSNVVITTAEGRPDSETTFIDIKATPLHTYQSESGYLEIDSSYPLNENITYTI